MSGFTTTGATVLDDIESLSHGLLFWRSLTQWIGAVSYTHLDVYKRQDHSEEYTCTNSLTAG